MAARPASCFSTAIRLAPCSVQILPYTKTDEYRSKRDRLNATAAPDDDVAATRKGQVLYQGLADNPKTPSVDERFLVELDDDDKPLLAQAMAAT